MEITRDQNVAGYFVVPLIDAANRPSYRASPTLAAGDVKIIRHTGGAWNVANPGTLPSVIGGATTQVLATLTAAELNPDDNQYPIIVQFIDQTAVKEWDDQTVIIWTRPVTGNLKQINDLSVAGNVATLTLKQLDIQNNAGDALIARATGANGNGIAADGNGGGAGIKALGGSSAPGVKATGGAGGNTNGVEATGVTGGNGMQLNAGLTGNGLKVYGGGTSGAAIRAIAQGGNSEAVLLEGFGAGAALKATPGATGKGIEVLGGATSGDAVSFSAQAGNGRGLYVLSHGGGTAAVFQSGITGKGVEIIGVATGLKITGGQGSSQGHGIHVIGGETVGSGDFHAVFLEAIGASCRGLKIKGAGTGAGMSSEGGLGGGIGIMAIGKVASAGFYATNDSEGGTGHGIWARAGEAGGNGIRATAYAETASGLHAEAEGVNGDGIRGQSGIDGDGISGYAAGTGIGINAVSDQGDGIRASGSVISGNGHGFRSTGGGTGHGGYFQSGTGATGDGLRAEAQSINGNGINCIKTGTGIDLKATDHSDGTWGHTVKKNTAVAKYKFVMLHETSGDPEPGLTVTAVKKLDAAGAWSAMSGSGTIVDNGSGVYSIDISQADSNGNTGAWKFTAPGAKATIITLLFES